MRRRRRKIASGAVAGIAVLAVVIGTASAAADEAFELAKLRGEFDLTKLRGEVVYLAEALAEREEIATAAEARQRILAVETTQGRFVPLVEDVRGRAFRADEHLRGRELVLLVRRYRSHPLAQVIRTFEPRGEDLYEIDYWCDICSIPMYELKPCDCCQGPIRLRQRKVDRSELPAVLRE